MVYTRDDKLTPAHVEMAETVETLLEPGGFALVGDRIKRMVFGVKRISEKVFRVSRMV